MAKTGKAISNYENSQQEEEVFKQSETPKEKLYNVVFKQNRSFELYVKGEKIIWNSHSVNPVFPEKYTNGLPQSIIDSVDFKNQQNYFTVIEKV